MSWFPVPPDARHGLASLLAVVALAGHQDPKAEATAAAVRAAWLYKLALYITVDAPDAKPQPQYRVGLLGDDSTTAVAKKILPGKKVGDAKVQVVAVSRDDAVAGRATAQCDLLYIATPIDDETLAKLLEQYRKQPLVLVCNRAGFAAAGGTVQMFVQDGAIRFEVNLEALQLQRLSASSQLLKHSEKGPAQ